MEMTAAIFDLDGVIVDTVPMHFKTWKKMFAEYGRSFTFGEYKQKLDGITRMEGTRAILTDLPEEEIKKASEKKQKYFLEQLKDEKIPVYTSTLSLMDQLKAKGIKVAVVSSSKNARKILQEIGLIQTLDTLVSGDDVLRGKPDPQIFIMASERLHVPPQQCTVFEDAAQGVEAAKRAGMFCVGIDRYGEPALFTKADVVVTDLEEIDYLKLKKLFRA